MNEILRNRELGCFAAVISILLSIYDDIGPRLYLPEYTPEPKRTNVLLQIAQNFLVPIIAGFAYSQNFAFRK